MNKSKETNNFLDPFQTIHRLLRISSDRCALATISLFNVSILIFLIRTKQHSDYFYSINGDLGDYGIAVGKSKIFIHPYKFNSSFIIQN